MVGIQANLSTYLKPFQEGFKVGSFNQIDNAYRYLRGSLKSQTGKRNIQRISEQDVDENYQSLHHFVSESRWDTDSVREVIRRKNQELMQGKRYGYLIDERSTAKKGNHSVGVSRQHCGSTGKIDNCQTGVYSVLTTSEFTLPCNFKLFLPESWTSCKKRLKKAGLNSSTALEKTKVDLAIDMIRQDRLHGILPEWYGADSLYGRAWKMTSYIEDECDAHFVMDTTIDQLIYLSDPTKNRRIKPITVEQYLQEFQLSKCRKVQYERNKKARVRIIEVFTKDTKRDKKPRRRLLVISKGLGRRDKVKFSLTNFTREEKTDKELIYMQRTRFSIEQYFRDASQLTGLGDYQIRSFLAWRHVQILSMLLMQLLNVIRKKLMERKTFLTVSTISRCIGPILLQIKNQKQIVTNILNNCNLTSTIQNQ